MKPYYQDDLVTIYHGDCLEIDVWLEADVLITDPPYGTQFTEANPRGGYGRRQDALGRGSRHAPATPGMGAWIANDATTETRDRVIERWGIKPKAVFGSPRAVDPPGEWADRLVWDKKRLGMNGGPWRYQHETIFVSAGFVRTSNEASSILRYFPDQSIHIHAKPVGLMSHLVATAPPGVIADPFMGSGSTLVAAKSLGRKAIGVEIEEKYCEIAAKRCGQDYLFGEVG